MTTTQTSLYQKALEALEALSLEDQKDLIETLNNRFNLRQREQLLAEIQEVQAEYKSGQVKFGSVNDFLEELDN
jgi:outer membrane protein assembly factor BamD (BamD/ComL family)